MPHDKIQEVIDILDSGEFGEDATEFEIDLCATLRGKSRWALLATRLGDSPALINIEKLRIPHKSNKRKVKPVRHHGESQALATTKFKNDMHIIIQITYVRMQRQSSSSNLFNGIYVTSGSKVSSTRPK
jgi:hypothetical protein